MLKKHAPSRVVNLSSMANWIFSPACGIEMEKQFSRHERRADGSVVTPSGHNPWAVYGQSKLANILHAKELQRRMDAEGSSVAAIALHPGVILSTGLAQYVMGPDKSIMWGMVQYPKMWYGSLTEPSKTIAQGAATTVFACLAPIGHATREVSKGAYYADCALSTPANGMVHAKAGDVELAEALWTRSEQAVASVLH